MKEVLMEVIRNSITPSFNLHFHSHSFCIFFLQEWKLFFNFFGDLSIEINKLLPSGWMSLREVINCWRSKLDLQTFRQSQVRREEEEEDEG